MNASTLTSRDLSVLVAEDDSALRTMFTALFKTLGYEIDCVNDGARALERLSQKSYSVMLLDLVMPGTNGYEVLEQLAHIDRSTLARTIVVTGVSQKEIAKIDASGIFAIVRKPFDIDGLIENIQACAAAATRRAPRASKRRQKISIEKSALAEPAAVAHS